MAAYYNEIDAFAADWLRNLIREGWIAPGDIDTRSIKDVQPDDLAGYAQCHFFAGSGGWSLALRLAGWPDDRPVWTGSCPCQPFSVAGKRKGFDDERDLWPEFYRLIGKRRPAVLFGEQVANAPEWVGRLRSDLEAVDYAVGCLPIEAASAGADHFRDRYWFVADDPGQRSQVPIASQASAERPAAARSDFRAVVDAARVGWGEGFTEAEFRSRGFTAAVASVGGCQFVECPDRKWRRLPPPGVRWLGTRIPARIPKLRTLGNAIDWRPAAEFIAAYCDVRAAQ